MRTAQPKRKNAKTQTRRQGGYPSLSMRQLPKLAGLAGILAVLSLGRLPAFTPWGCQRPHPRMRIVKADVTDLARTYVTPHLEEAITGSDNLVWSSAFQLAWNELHTLIGEDIHFEKGDPSMVVSLNKMSATKDDIDEASYVAMAGFVEDAIINQIQQAMQQKFPGSSPQLVPSQQGLRPEDMVAYACLFKQLMFSMPFERLDDPLYFGSQAVSAFGVGREDKPGHVNMLDQVSILDYSNSDDFVIELKTQATQDQVILAKIQPGSTLGETIQTVLARIAADTPEPMVAGDWLEIPRIDFDLARTYTELIGLKLQVQNPELADKDFYVLQAKQDIRFVLNEEGVTLESEAAIVMGCGATGEPEPIHIMVFDKPFLIMIKRTQADQPYFALWIANPELLAQSSDS